MTTLSASQIITQKPLNVAEKYLLISSIYKTDEHSAIQHKMHTMDIPMLEQLFAGAIAQIRMAPVFNALTLNCPHIIQLLIKYGANINETNNVGETPLFHAIRMKQPLKVIEELIYLGANVNHQTNKGHTPLMIATATNDGMITPLLKAGANIALKDTTGLTTYDWALKWAKETLPLFDSYMEHQHIGVMIKDKSLQGKTKPSSTL